MPRTRRSAAMLDSQAKFRTIRSSILPCSSLSKMSLMYSSLASGVLAAGVLAAALGRCRKGGHAAVRFSTTSKIGVNLPFSSPNARRSHDAHRVQVGVTYTERFGLCEEVAGTRRNNRRALYQQRFCEFAYGCSLHCYLEHGKSPRLVLNINQQGWIVEFPGADISSSLQS